MTAPEQAPSISLEVDGTAVDLPATGTLLDALRDQLGVTIVKDGCSPQGQCGCCTVLVDGVARVACVTPLRRVAGRSITTPAGLEATVLGRLVDAFEATGASQCGFCTPGILARLVALARRGVPTEDKVRTALGAHLCRCTGFQPIVEAAMSALDPDAVVPEPRDPAMASQRATLESGTPQRAGADVVLGGGGFAADTAPAGTRVALATVDGDYVIAGSVAGAREAAAKIQGRNSTVPLRLPLDALEVDDAVLTLRTTFVEPAYVEPDASWCAPGGDSTTPFSNAGAFGAKRSSTIMADARRLAEGEGSGILALWPREEVVRRGAKRPPISLALRADGSGRLAIATTPSSDDLTPLINQLFDLAPGLEVELVEVVGPRIGASHRGAVIAEVLAARAAIGHLPGEPVTVTTANGATATVVIDAADQITVTVTAGAPLCAVTLRSYVIGAVHQGLSMVRSEGIAVDTEGIVHDLTIRSFGIMSASDMPPVDVSIVDDGGEPVAAGVAVFAATMAAAWVAAGTPPAWPTNREVQ